MTDRPIIFSAPMVRALLDGRKHQTRRLAWTEPATNVVRLGDAIGDDNRILRPSPWQRVQVGDRLWVREAWWCEGCYDDFKPRELLASAPVYFQTEPEPGCAGRYRHAQFLPRWASRLTLTVTEARRQRLQEISEEDATAEGVDAVSLADIPRQASWSRRQDFSRLWNHLHGADAWAANPEVVAISFSAELRNIDSQRAAA